MAKRPPTRRASPKKNATIPLKVVGGTDAPTDGRVMANELGAPGVPSVLSNSPPGQQQLLEFIDTSGTFTGTAPPPKDYLPPDDGLRRVTVMKDHGLKYPELYLSVYVAGTPQDDALFAEMFTRADCYKASSLDKADVVVFTGGSDVSPELYGESKHGTTHNDIGRDLLDIALYKECLSQGKPMVGICRGSQFLAVMNDAKLYQDVNNHMGAHDIFDLRDNKNIPNVSSDHHQMVIGDTRMEILATSQRASTRWLNVSQKIDGTHPDVEAFFYRDTCCLGVQGHPEYRNYPYFTRWFLQLMYEHIYENPDLKYENGALRIKQELMATRMNGLTQRTIDFVAKHGKKEK